jgi:hypothetical protein
MPVRHVKVRTGGRNSLVTTPLATIDVMHQTAEVFADSLHDLP